MEEEPSIEATIDLPPPLPRSNPPSQSNSTASTPSSNSASVSATLSLSSVSFVFLYQNPLKRRFDFDFGSFGDGYHCNDADD